MKRNLLFILAFMFVSANMPAKNLILDKKYYNVNNNVVSFISKYNPRDVYGLLNFLMQYSEETKKWNYEILELTWKDIYNALMGRPEVLIDKLSSRLKWEKEEGLNVLTEIDFNGFEDRKLVGKFSGRNFRYLEKLHINDNKIESLDLTKNIFLKYLYCSNNQINTLDLSKNISLYEIYCRNNNLSILDVSNNINLVNLFCEENKLTQLNLSNSKYLKFLACDANQLTTIDVSVCSYLQHLLCAKNLLTEIDVSKNFELYRLDCYNNSISALDLSNNSKLEVLYGHNNQLTKLDISKNPKLHVLNCSYNKLTSLDVAMDVFQLSCSHNFLKFSTLNINSKNLVNAYVEPQETIQGGSKGFYEIIDLSSEFKSKNGMQTYYLWYDKATGLPVTMYAYKGRFIAGPKNAGKTLICKMRGGSIFLYFKLEYEVTIQKILPFSAKSLTTFIPENFKLIGGQENETESIQLFPNPVIDILKISTAAKVTSASVYNYAGKEVKRYPKVINNELDLQDLPAGNYIVNLTTDQGILSKKIIKK